MAHLTSIQDWEKFHRISELIPDDEDLSVLVELSGVKGYMPERVMKEFIRRLKNKGKYEQVRNKIFALMLREGLAVSGLKNDLRKTGSSGNKPKAKPAVTVEVKTAEEVVIDPVVCEEVNCIEIFDPPAEDIANEQLHHSELIDGVTVEVVSFGLVPEVVEINNTSCGDVPFDNEGSQVSCHLEEQVLVGPVCVQQSEFLDTSCAGSVFDMSGWGFVGQSEHLDYASEANLLLMEPATAVSFYISSGSEGSLQGVEPWCGGDVGGGLDIWGVRSRWPPPTPPEPGGRALWRVPRFARGTSAKLKR